MSADHISPEESHEPHEHSYMRIRFTTANTDAVGQFLLLETDYHRQEFQEHLTDAIIHAYTS
ncbi:MAG: hypothetical protein HRU15_03755 [Planctomycetes bacterium]|nr:hypothetical protein [Planctomycetota bacterium]